MVNNSEFSSSDQKRSQIHELKGWIDKVRQWEVDLRPVSVETLGDEFCKFLNEVYLNHMQETDWIESNAQLNELNHQISRTFIFLDEFVRALPNMEMPLWSGKQGSKLKNLVTRIEKIRPSLHHKPVIKPVDVTDRRKFEEELKNKLSRITSMCTNKTYTNHTSLLDDFAVWIQSCIDVLNRELERQQNSVVKEDRTFVMAFRELLCILEDVVQTLQKTPDYSMDRQGVKSIGQMCSRAGSLLKSLQQI